MTGSAQPTLTTGTAARTTGVPPWWILLIPAALLLAASLRGDDQAVALDPLPACAPGAIDASRANPTAEPHLTVLVFDVSSSVIDSGGADPRGQSFDEARWLAEALAAQPCTSDDRMGAVIFASQSVEVPATLLTSLSVLDATLARPPDREIGAGTNLTGALERVVELVERFPEHEGTVVVLSDMQVGDHDPVRSRLARLGGHHLHLVALGDYDSRFDDAFETVNRLRDVDGGVVAQALADAVSRSRKEGNT